MKKILLVDDSTPSRLDSALSVAGWHMLWRDGAHAIVMVTSPAALAAVQPLLLSRHLHPSSSVAGHNLPAKFNGKGVTVYDLLHALTGGTIEEVGL